jgi:hypothetical protein
LIAATTRQKQKQMVIKICLLLDGACIVKARLNSSSSSQPTDNLSGLPAYD